MGGCPSFQTVKQLQALLFLPQKNLHPAFKKFPLQFTCAPSTRSEWRERERERASKVMHCSIGFASLCSVIGPKITALLFLGQFVSFYFEF